jgi:hypothetical protein
MNMERKLHGNLDEVMYPNDFDYKDDENDSYDHEDNTGMDGTKKKKLLKGTKPREIMGDGSLYHVILVYFLQELRPFVLQLGLDPTAVELGTAGFLHEPVYNKLVNVYNDATRESLKSFKMDNAICITYGVHKNAPATFDKLSALAFSQAINFINKHYREAVQKCPLSGNYKPFFTYCTNRLHLLLYYNSITKCGDTVLGSLACPKLPEGVKRTSLEDGTRKENQTKRAPTDREKENTPQIN